VRQLRVAMSSRFFMVRFEWERTVLRKRERESESERERERVLTICD
jgi:hypothetical protein